MWVRVILVVLSRLWGGGVADRGTGKGADFLAKNIIIEYGFNLLVLSRCTCELCWHCRVVVVVLVAMAVRTKFFAVFFDGVLLSQKTHGLLLASVT